MRPQRTMFGGGGFSGGGRVTTPLVIGIAIVSILLSIGANTYAGQEVLVHLRFSPARVIHGELWQVVTYAFVHPLQTVGILGFIFGLLLLWSIGGQVEAVLGPRRYLGFYVSAAALGALVTIPLALLLEQSGTSHDGVWVGVGAIIVLFAREFADRQILLMFVLPVKGKWLIAASFGFVGLAAIVAGPVTVMPEFFAMVFALAWAEGVLASPRKLWLRFRAWQIERELKRRSSHLSVIRGGEDDADLPPPPRKKDDGKGPWLH